MHNPFKKPSQAPLIAAVVAGATLTGVLTWLLTTEKGEATRRRWKAGLKEKGKDLIAEVISKKTGVSKKLTKPATDAIVD